MIGEDFRGCARDAPWQSLGKRACYCSVVADQPPSQLTLSGVIDGSDGEQLLGP